MKHNKFWGSFYLVAFNFSHYEMGCAQKVLRGGGGEGRNKFWTCDFPIL